MAALNDENKDDPKTGTSQKIGGDNVTQNDPAPVTKTATQTAGTTVFVGELRNGQPVRTPDDPGFSYQPSQPARPKVNMATQRVLDNQAASQQRTALWRQHDQENRSARAARVQGAMADVRAARMKNDEMRRGWKEGKLDGMKSIDADTWDALGRRDGGTTSTRVKDDKGNLIVDGRNADGSPIFRETYQDNGGSKFDAEKNADAIARLNNWWMKEGGFQSSRGKIPAGVFGKDGTIDVSKIKTDDQFRAVQQVMNSQIADGKARRDQALRNLDDSRRANGTDAELRGRDKDAEYLLSKGVRLQFDPKTGQRIGIQLPGADGKTIRSKWSDGQLAAVAQEYRRNDALAALQGFEESKKNTEAPAGEPGEDGAITYFDDGGDFEARDAQRIQDNLIAAGRAAGLRSDQMGDEAGNIDPERIRAALEGAAPEAPAAPRAPAAPGQPVATEEDQVSFPGDPGYTPPEAQPAAPEVPEFDFGQFERDQFDSIMAGTDGMAAAPMTATEPEAPAELPGIDETPGSLMGGPRLDLKGPSIFNTAQRFSEPGSIIDRGVSELADTLPFVDRIPAVQRAQARDFGRTVDAYARLNPGVPREQIAAQLQRDKQMQGMMLSAISMSRAPVRGAAIPRMPSGSVVPVTRAPARAPVGRPALPSAQAAPRLTANRPALPAPAGGPLATARSAEAMRAESAMSGLPEVIPPRGSARTQGRPSLGSRRLAEIGYDGAIDAEFTSLPPTRVPGEARVARVVANTSPAGKRAKPKRR